MIIATVAAAVVIVTLLRFGIEYSLTRPSESGAWFWRNTRRDMLRWLYGGIAAVLPPAILNFYLIFSIRSWLLLPSAVVAGMIHMKLIDSSYPLNGMQDSERGVFLIKYTLFHLVSAVTVWWLLLI